MLEKKTLIFLVLLTIVQRHLNSIDHNDLCAFAFEMNRLCFFLIEPRINHEKKREKISVIVPNENCVGVVN